MWLAALAMGPWKLDDPARGDACPPEEPVPGTGFSVPRVDPGLPHSGAPGDFPLRGTFSGPNLQAARPGERAAAVRRTEVSSPAGDIGLPPGKPFVNVR